MSDAVEFSAVPEVFDRWLAGRPLADRSRREYARNVRAYCAWLAETPDRAGWQGDPLTDPLARDHAARDFRRFLQVERRRGRVDGQPRARVARRAVSLPRGDGRPHVRRDKPVLAAPRALDEAAQRRLLRAADNAAARSRALVVLMLFTALRITEAVALDVDDVRILTRKGVLVVIGKGEQREVPLNALVRQVLDEWLEQRKDIAAKGERALFVSRTGGPLRGRAALPSGLGVRGLLVQKTGLRRRDFISSAFEARVAWHRCRTSGDDR